MKNRYKVSWPPDNGGEDRTYKEEAARLEAQLHHLMQRAQFIEEELRRLYKSERLAALNSWVMWHANNGWPEGEEDYRRRIHTEIAILQHELEEEENRARNLVLPVDEDCAAGRWQSMDNAPLDGQDALLELENGDFAVGVWLPINTANPREGRWVLSIDRKTPIPHPVCRWARIYRVLVDKLPEWRDASDHYGIRQPHPDVPEDELVQKHKERLRKEWGIL